MAILPIYNASGAKVGDYEIDPRQIAPKISKQLLHEVVVMYLANNRQGSNKTKARCEVSGSTKKLYRQKGTGNARVGSRRAPQRRGGGHAHARQPRSYYFRLPRKAVQAATRMAIASKIDQGNVVVLDSFGLSAPKTKAFAATFKALSLDGVRATVATAGIDRNVYLSGRNVPGVTISPVADLNALSVISPRKLVVTKDALDWIKSRAAV